MTTRVVEINGPADFDREIENNRLAVVFYGSKNCGHCKSMKDDYATLSMRYTTVKFVHVEITKVKVDGLDTGVPVFVMYKEREVSGEPLVGADRDALKRMVADLVK